VMVGKIFLNQLKKEAVKVIPLMYKYEDL